MCQTNRAGESCTWMHRTWLDGRGEARGGISQWVVTLKGVVVRAVGGCYDERDWVLIICQQQARAVRACASVSARINTHLELFPPVLNHVLGGTEIEPRIKFVDDSA